MPEPLDPQAALEATERFWTQWMKRCGRRDTAPTPCVRSLITLKALTYWPTGGIVAAPTTSLPEHLGGSRNWDYRFCWLRDATLTLLALMDAGFYDEAQAWRQWLVRAVAGSPRRLQRLGELEPGGAHLAVAVGSEAGAQRSSTARSRPVSGGSTSRMPSGIIVRPPPRSAGLSRLRYSSLRAGP